MKPEEFDRLFENAPRRRKPASTPVGGDALRPAPRVRRDAPGHVDPSSTDGSFEEYQMERVFEHLHLADETLTAAQEDGDRLPSALSAYAELGKQMAAMRERWLVLRERQRKLVDLDEVMMGIGPELAEARRLLQGFGKRLAAEMDCDLEERAARIDAAVDRVFKSFDAAEAAAVKVFSLDDIEA